MAQPSPRLVRKLYIAKEDCKERYRKKGGEKRVRAYVKSVEISRKLKIDLEFKAHGTIQFMFEKREDLRLVQEDIQGELCTIEGVKKYDSAPPDYLDIPSVHIKERSVSQTARKAMRREDQERLQREAPTAATLTLENLEKHDRKYTTGPCELRQFACGICMHYWWRTVLTSKPVSRCRGGKCRNTRYDALPRNKEFGIGRFICPKDGCGRVFYGFCEATDRLRCRKCKTLAKPHIHPKWRKRKRKSDLNAGAKPFHPRSGGRSRFGGRRQDDFGPKFEPTSGAGYGSGYASDYSTGYQQGPPSDATGQYFQAYSSGGEDHSQPSLHEQFAGMGFRDQARPRSSGSERSSSNEKRGRPRRIFNASKEHEPEGGTESTFLSQIDFETNFEEVDLAYDIDDHDEKIGVCNFECNCGNTFICTVRMMDQAQCYECNEWNDPLTWAPPGDYTRKSDAKHSCSRCDGGGNCPNLHK